LTSRSVSNGASAAQYASRHPPILTKVATLTAGRLQRATRHVRASCLTGMNVPKSADLACPHAQEPAWCAEPA